MLIVTCHTLVNETSQMISRAVGIAKHSNQMSHACKRITYVFPKLNCIYIFILNIHNIILYKLDYFVYIPFITVALQYVSGRV